MAAGGSPGRCCTGGVRRQLQLSNCSTCYVFAQAALAGPESQTSFISRCRVYGRPLWGHLGRIWLLTWRAGTTPAACGAAASHDRNPCSSGVCCSRAWDVSCKRGPGGGAEKRWGSQVRVGLLAKYVLTAHHYVMAGLRRACPGQLRWWRRWQQPRKEGRGNQRPVAHANNTFTYFVTWQPRSLRQLEIVHTPYLGAVAHAEVVTPLCSVPEVS